MRLRTFIAVVASPEIRRSARKLTDLLLPSAGDVIWVAPENLHWTLQFLGDVEQLELPAICKAVSTAAAEFDPFDLSAHGAGAFPAPDRPKTLWIGAGAGAQVLIALQASVQSKLERLGYRGEARRYLPHLTLGRAGRSTSPKSLVRELAALADFDAGTMLVDELVVFSSQLRKDGPIYDVLARAPLAG